MAYADLVKADGAIGYWPLDEASGTVATDQIGGRNGTYTGGYTPRGAVLLPGSPGSVDLNGSSGYVNWADNTAWSPITGTSGAMTLELWLMLDALAASGNSESWVWTKGSASNFEWAMRIIYTGTVGINLWTSAGSGVLTLSTSPTALSLGQAYHVVGVYDRTNSQAKIYVDGEQWASSTSFNAVSVSNGSAPMRIGARGDGDAEYFNGKVGHAAFYNTALTADQVKSHYRAGLREKVMY